LKYWLQKIRGSENEPSDNNKCQVCSATKWTGGKFCWNENCLSSPLFYKLRDTINTNFRTTIPEHCEGSVQKNIQLEYSSQKMDIPENEISDFVSPESCIAPAAVDITCSDDAIVASLKRPREDSISMTDCEARTPERSWSNENLTLKASGVSVASMDGIDAFHYAEQVI
jgi:hypothetical protein